jgi:glutathione peroxidase
LTILPAAMLLWISSEAVVDDDEKGGKLLRRRARDRVIHTALTFLGCLCILFLMSLHSSKRDPADTNAKVRSWEIRQIVQRQERPDHFQDNSPPPLLPANSIYRLSIEDPFGEMVSLQRFAGRVTLVVNTACKWGKTRLEYHQLALLHEKFQDQGFSILAFPSNDFHQELGTNEEIYNFWRHSFPEATFPIFAESSLAENPVYKRLREHLPDSQVRHNFFKYLVGRDGIAVAFYTKKQDPETLEPAIQNLLNTPIKLSS